VANRRDAEGAEKIECGYHLAGTLRELHASVVNTPEGAKLGSANRLSITSSDRLRHSAHVPGRLVGIPIEFREGSQSYGSKSAALEK
jgi:hypothetical protein